MINYRKLYRMKRQVKDLGWPEKAHARKWSKQDHLKFIRLSGKIAAIESTRLP